MRQMPDRAWMLTLELPHGHHRYAFIVDGVLTLDPRAQDFLFIAGGIGITPIMAMIREVQRQGKRFRLFYCSRSPETTAFQKLSASVPSAWITPIPVTTTRRSLLMKQTF